MTQRLHVVIVGRVQGVGFRYFVLRHARALTLDGCVWNRRDGAVVVEAEGGRDALEHLLDDLRRGPSGADVLAAHATWSKGPAQFRGFDIR